VFKLEKAALKKKKKGWGGASHKYIYLTPRLVMTLTIFQDKLGLNYYLMKFRILSKKSTNFLGSRLWQMPGLWNFFKCLAYLQHM